MAVITRGQPSTLLSITPSTTSNVCTWPVNPTASSKIILWVYTGLGDTSVPGTVVDNGTTPRTFNQVVAVTGYTDKAWIYFADDITLPSSGAYTVTVPLSPVGSAVAVFGMELIDAQPGAPQSTAQQDNSLSGSVTGITVGPLGSGSGNYYAALMSLSGGGSPAGIVVATPFTQQAVEQSGGLRQAGSMADYTGDGSQSCSWSWTIGNQCTIAMAVFAPSQAAPASAPGEGFSRSTPTLGGGTPGTG